MRASMSLVSSTGASLRLRKSFPTSSMDAKARSASFMCHIKSQAEILKLSPALQKPLLEDFFLVTEIPEGADVGNDERQAELILRPHLPEIDASIFDSEATAAAVVTELSDLVLQRLVLEIVAQTCDEIEPLAGFASVADEPANLVGIRLLEHGQHRRRLESKIAGRRIVIQAEVGNGGKSFPIRFYFQERADGDESLNSGIVLKNLLQIVETAGSDL